MEIGDLPDRIFRRGKLPHARVSAPDDPGPETATFIFFDFSTPPTTSDLTSHRPRRPRNGSADLT